MYLRVIILKTYQMMTKKQKENEMNFSQIVDEAALILQRKSDNVMTIKQVANYLGISVGAVRKRYQRNQLPYHRNANRLYFSRMEVDDVILERVMIGQHMKTSAL
jgi:excisionase family DNA binding protein